MRQPGRAGCILLKYQRNTNGTHRITALHMFKVPTILLLAVGMATPLVLVQAQEPARTTSADRTHDFLGLGPAPDAAAAKLGEPLYQGNCSACHGAGARGGVGPNLLRSVLVLHDEKGEEIGQVVKNGRAAMPSFPNLSQADVYNIAEFIHLQVEMAANRGMYKQSDKLTTGTAAAGKVFFDANCASCHSATEDLAHVGTKYIQPAALMLRIIWPEGRAPRKAVVTTPTGEKLTGTLAHYDDFVTELRAPDGTTTKWPTEAIKVDIADPMAGHRALMPRYSDNDLHNLTQYLSTLK